MPEASTELDIPDIVHGPEIKFLLDCLPIPIIVLGQPRLVRYANSAAVNLLRRGTALKLAEGRLRIRRRQEGKDLDCAVQRAISSRHSVLFKVCSRQDHVLHALMLHPIPEHDAEVLVLASTDLTVSADTSCFRGLFGLTPAEARVASALADGCDAAAIAARDQVRPDTVRGHLKHVYLKTGTHSQLQLIRLLSSSLLVTAGTGVA